MDLTEQNQNVHLFFSQIRFQRQQLIFKSLNCVFFYKLVWLLNKLTKVWFIPAFMIKAKCGTKKLMYDNEWKLRFGIESHEKSMLEMWLLQRLWIWTQ